MKHRTTRKKKRERTWAEAATQVLARGNGRPMCVRQIQQKIYQYKLKDIKMTKLAENVLKTMLSHHANMEDCPFFKVKDKTGYYALKAHIPPCSVLSKDDYEEESERHHYTAHHESDDCQQNDEEMSILRRRRVSDQFLESFPRKLSNLPTLDLETPQSILTNTHLKSVINNSTFAMLPTSYQLTLLNLLPAVDHKVNDESGMLSILPTALTNEFFSQALQDWVSKLSEGEFTRETQAKLSQEFSKESSRLSPWKEKFFEEYYGQKSADLGVASTFADLSFEAQVSKLRKLQDSVENDNKYQLDDSSDLWKEKKYWPDSPIDTSPKDDADSMALLCPRPHLSYANLDRLSHMHVSDGWMPMYPNLRVREDFYHSDMSDSGELSDTNSYHQHATTDESEQSSDEIMNIGDDNLLDVDEEEEDEILDDRSLYPVVSEHSYTKLPGLKRKLSEDRIWKRARSTIASVMPVTCKDDSYKPTYTTSSGSTLVLRPKDNLRLSVQAITCNEENNGSSPKQQFTPLVTKNFSEERVGVLFSKELHAENHTEKPSEDEVVPKITIYKEFSDVLSNGTTIRRGQASSGEKDSKVVQILKNGEKKSTNEMNSMENCKNNSLVLNNSSVLKCGPAQANVNQQYSKANRFTPTCQSSDVITPAMNQANHELALQNLGSFGKIEKPANEVIPHAKINPIKSSDAPPDHESASSNTASVSQVNTGASLTKPEVTDSVPHTETTPTSPSVTTAICSSTDSSRNSTGQKRPQANIRSGPVKRTKTLAEIKAQMKAKKMASVSQSSSAQNSPKSNKATNKDITSVQNDSSNVSQSSKNSNIEHGSLGRMQSNNHEHNMENKQSNLKTSSPIRNDSDKNESNRSLLTEKSVESLIVGNLKTKEDPTTVQTPSEETVTTNEKIVLKIKAERGKTYSVQVKTTDGSQLIPLENEKDLKPEATQMDSHRDEVVCSKSGSSEVMFSKKIPENLENSSRFSTTTEKELHGSPKLNKREQLFSNTELSDHENQPIDQLAQVQSQVPKTSSPPTSINHGTHDQTQHAQKYQTTSKGKSWLQMQQLAISNMDQLDVSDMSETDSEEMISILSSGSSLENYDCRSNEICDLLSNSSNSRNSMISSKVENIFDVQTRKESEGAKHYSSHDDLTVKFDCACSCSRLLLCKGCGAYTHEECLSSNSLCSLCITY